MSPIAPRVDVAASLGSHTRALSSSTRSSEDVAIAADGSVAVPTSNGAPVLVRVPTWRRVGAVQHKFSGGKGSWNASIRPADKREPLSTETFERHVKLAAMEVQQTGLARTASRGSFRSRTPTASKSRPSTAGAGARGSRREPASAPRLQRKSTGSAHFLRQRVASPSMRRTASSNGMSRVASHHSLRAGVGRPISRSASKRRLRRSAHSQSMHSMTHMPALAPAPTSPKARVSVASSYVPWSPIHRAPKGKWNASKAPDPRPEYLSNDAYIRAVGLAAINAAPQGVPHRTSLWRAQIVRGSQQ